jgi:hypothetical protein
MSVIPSPKLSLEHLAPHSGEEHEFDTITEKCDTYIWVVLKKEVVMKLKYKITSKLIILLRV